MLITQTFEDFQVTLADEAGADSVVITPLQTGEIHLRFVRGDVTCERIVTDEEMDQPWENIALEAKEALDA